MQFTLAAIAHACSNLKTVAWTAASVVCMSSAIAAADQPLHVRIDERMAEIHPGPESALCSDGEFLRRAYLDLVGTIPPGDEARRFIADVSPDKRTRIVDELLANPIHAKYMAQVFDVMLMERRADKYVKDEQWQSYLLTSFQQNKPFNELARDILAADGVDQGQRGPAKFYLEREVEPNLLTREVGRMFFGMDFQCAQCHDHPNIDDYYQSDYYGLFAFVNRSYLFQPDKKKPAVLAEKAEGDATFKSVFTAEEGRTLPRLPGGAEIDEPTFAKDDGYQVKPDPKKKEVRPVPKFSRREQLAIRATDGSNRAFNRNLANRLWAQMMGRGLVHPVDQHHSDNPPIHPQLLELLADELLQTNFNVRSMLRELALSHTYQRSIDLPQDFREHAKSALQQLDRWNQRSVEFANAVKQSQSAVNALEKKLHDVKASLPPAIDAEKKSREALAASQKIAEDAQKAMVDGQQALTEKQSVAALLAEAVAKTTAATEILKDDKELGNALQVLQARRRGSDEKVTVLADSLTALTAAHQAATKKRTEAQKVAANATDELKTTRDAVTSLAKSLAESMQKLRLDQTSVSHASGQIARLKIAVAYGEAVRRHDALERETESLAGRLASTEKAIAKLTPEVNRLKLDLPKADSAHAEAAIASATANQQLESTREAAGLMAASFSKANEAAQILADDAELKTAVATLETHSRDLSGKVASLDMLVAEAIAAEKQLISKVQSLRAETKKANDDLAGAIEQSKKLRAEHAAKAEQLSDLTESLQTQRDTLTTAWSQQFSIAVVQPLSPEQLAWSILNTTGYIDRQRASVQAAMDKKSPLKPEEKGDKAKVAAREQEIEKQTETQLNGIVKRFVQLYGAAAGQPQDDFFATVDQALFVSNGGELRTWLAPAAGNLTDRLQKIDDAKALADDLYLSILTRFPTAAETADVAKYLSSPERQKPEAVQEMAWALLTSAEFRFQH